MPAVGALIAAAASAAAASFSIASILTSLATSFVMSGLQKLLTPKPKRPNFGGPALQSGITTQVKQAIVTRKLVYGEQRISGGTLFMSSSEGNNYLHYIIELGANELTSIGEIWVNDYSVAEDHFDANGLCNSGRYSGLLRVKLHLGSAGQTADAALVAELPAYWTTDHKLSGVPYIYLRLKWDQDKFPNGFPNMSVFVKGKSLLDPRTGGYAYSNNIALMAYNFLLDNDYGIGATSAEIDSDFVTAAANTCDEFVTTADLSMTVSSVAASTDIITLSGTKLEFQTGDRVTVSTTTTLPGGISAATNYYVIAYQRKDTVRIKLASSYANALAGTAINITDSGSGTHTVTKNAEPRYTGAAYLDSAEEIGENLKDILTGMLGEVIYAGGSYRLMAGAYQTPTIYFDENDIISPISVQTKISKRERFNEVHGKYISPINSGQPSDYPVITNSTYLTEDGEKIIRQLDMPVTQRPHTAQRLAKIALEQSRQEITWSADFNLSAMLVQAGDNAYFSNSRLGWTNKVFKVVSWRLDSRDDNGVQVPFINMTLRETASGVYDWASGEETSIDLAANTDLPDPFTVAAITGLAVDSEAVATTAGDSTFKILIGWDAVTDTFVSSGGFVEIQFKKSADSEWRPTYTVPGASTFTEVTLAAQLNEEYDIRLRAVNNMGVRSNYTTISNFVVGTSGGVGTTYDWGNWTSTVTSTNDWGDWTSTVTSSADWGYFT